MDAARWQHLSAWLDQLLELAPEARQLRLQRLAAQDPTLGRDLERLLEQEAESQDFMAQPLWTAPPPGRAGSQVGPYRLLRPLGEGGMGEVWLAERCDGLYQRQVALKLLRSGVADPGLRQRFGRERQILARLQHPHLAQLLDAGVDQHGQPYLALDYVEGEPISDYCRRLQPTLETRLQLMLQVCAVVSHAHANLVVHRDLKPSNILVRADGTVKLLDFGIATLLDNDDPDATHPPTEVRAFTLHYAAPEQVRGEAMTTLTDVYSLGVVLFEVVTGHKPYRLRRHSDAEWERSILDVQAPRASALLQRLADEPGAPRRALQRQARRLRGDLDVLLEKALQKDPAQRYASAEALAGDLRRYLQGQPIHARPPGVGYRMRKYIGRHRWGVALASLAVLGLLGTTSIALWQARQARLEMARAQAMQDFTVGLFDKAASQRHGHFDVPQLLATGQQRGEAELADQPLALAELEGVIGRLRIGLGDYQLALQTLDQQRHLLQQVGEVPPGLQLEAVTQRGRALRMLGRDRDCLAHLLPLQSLAAAQASTLPAGVAEFHSQLGRCQAQLGDAVAARRSFEQALALRRQGIAERFGRAESLADLAGLDAAAGRLPDALAGYQQALALLDQPSDASSPQVIGLHRQLGEVLARQGQLQAAATELELAWQAAQDAWGPRHPEALVVRRARALLALQRGQRDLAGQELRQVQAQLLGALGPDHREIGHGEFALGQWASANGDASLAAAHYARAAGLWRQPDHTALLPQALLAEGHALQQAGQATQARAVLAEARQLLLAQRGPQAPALRDLDAELAALAQAEPGVQPSAAR
ncbi:TPA: protein kinase [Stenotrophomonas maltophilia]|uniref:protein kinase domain-containing protein n=1 Tax=Stenotrophomonas sp. TaxID=69392 RepID=UPI0028B0A446|nr:protein kinase [Stenotrophomonas sp.]HDS0949095.1 protein kinase [Stenotrophomonas maltophilia]HDS1025352.1 protein kinase [Stenotrophomonas maltophilia]HDS1029662.1 protein kinase [Stenotrophomonas maltophilia]HDS1034760.1 protein kinase [Stenotrophomonas maltophilia]